MSYDFIQLPKNVRAYEVDVLTYDTPYYRESDAAKRFIPRQLDEKPYVSRIDVLIKPSGDVYISHDLATRLIGKNAQYLDCHLKIGRKTFHRFECIFEKLYEDATYYPRAIAQWGPTFKNVQRQWVSERNLKALEWILSL